MFDFDANAAPVGPVIPRRTNGLDASPAFMSAVKARVDAAKASHAALVSTGTLPGAELVNGEKLPPTVIPQVPAAAPQLPVQPEKVTKGTDSAGRMIFLRRANDATERYWVVRFLGIPGLPETELPAGVPCGATLRDVLGWLAQAYVGKLAGAWLMVAP